MRAGRPSSDPSGSAPGPGRPSSDPSGSAPGPGQASFDPSRSAPGPDQASFDPSRSAPGPDQASFDPSRSAPGPGRPAVSSVRRASRSVTGLDVGSNTATGPAMPGTVSASSLRRGSRPARSTDDLPAPDGPTSISGRVDACAARETSCSVTSSRPKNQRASWISNLARPRYGVSVLLPGA